MQTQAGLQRNASRINTLFTTYVFAKYALRFSTCAASSELGTNTFLSLSVGPLKSLDFIISFPQPFAILFLAFPAIAGSYAPHRELAASTVSVLRAMAKVASDFEKIIKDGMNHPQYHISKALNYLTLPLRSAGRERKKNEMLAEKIFSRDKRQLRASPGPSLASRVGVKKVRN